MDEQELDFTKFKYVLYARKSTDDPQRQVRSIGDQIFECKQLAARLGLFEEMLKHHQTTTSRGGEN